MSGCSGSFAFKRRYTDATTDSYALVCISGGATFSGIENGTYVDCVTGDTKTVTNGTLSVSCSGKGNLRVYVLNTSKTPAPGKVGVDGKYLYQSSPAGGSMPNWDGTQEELTDDPTLPDEPEEAVEPCLTSAIQRTVFFTKSSDFGKKINCYIWNSNGTVTNAWPGATATSLGNGKYRFDIPASAPAIDGTWMIIWNDGSTQTRDLTFTNQGMYTGGNKDNINCTSIVTALCEGGDSGETPVDPNPNPAPAEMCLKSVDERVVFFEKSSDFGSNINCYLWFTDGSTTEICGKWPGKAATHLYDNVYRFEIPATAPAINSQWMIIWNDGSGNQTKDLKYTNQGLYTGSTKDNISCSSRITALCETTALKDATEAQPVARKVLIGQSLYLMLPNGDVYDISGRKVR
jgi:hypothetical protein